MSQNMSKHVILVQNMSFWVNLGENFKKPIVIFGINTFEKIFKFQTNNALIRHNQARTWKTYCPIWNQYLRNCENTKFNVKEKKLNLGQKSPYIWSHQTGICKIWYRKKSFKIDFPNVFFDHI